MTQTTITRRSVGINFNGEGQAEVTVWSPNSKKVAISLINKKITIDLHEDGYGYWKTVSNLIKPDDLYKVSVDGNAFPDPTSLHQPEGVHGPSRALNLANHQWSDENWNNLALEEYVIYELHIGTFTPEGTFAGAIAKLDYLQELGVNAIEVMPVAQFPGGRNWGYDGVLPYAVQNTYGGAEGFMQLIDACHSKGIAVILDVVYNHMGPEGNYFSAFGPYFTKKYNTPWGEAINFDDEWCDGVRDYFIQNVLMWFRDFHVDALRLDAVHAIKDFSPTHILREMKQEVNRLMAHTGRKHHMIVELDLNDNRFINPLEQQGFGMDAQWIDEFHHALRVTAGESRTGYYADFDGINHLAKAYSDAYVFDGIYSSHRKKIFGVKAENNPGKQFIVFSQNHDQIGNRMLGERTSNLVSFEMQKLLAAAVVVAPYLPMLFMGEEYSEPHPFQYFVSHTDPELAEAVRKGRKEEFKAFHSGEEAPDPVSEKTFEESKLQWDLLRKEPHKTMYNYYKSIIALRKSEAALRNLDRNHLNVSCKEEKKTLQLIRWHDNEHVVCLMNFSQVRQEMQLPSAASDWKKIFDSASPQWKGSEEAPSEASESISIQPESIVIYKNTHE